MQIPSSHDIKYFNCEIKEFCDQTYISTELFENRHSYYLKDYVLKNRAKFAQGTLRTVSENTQRDKTSKTVNTDSILILASDIDAIKKIITDFCPDLTFGWLKPNFKKLTISTTTNITNHYKTSITQCSNIYPVPINSKENIYTVSSITPSMWLTDTPSYRI